MMIKQLLAALMLLALASGAAHADEASVKKAVEAKLPNAKVESVRKTPHLGGLYEVVVQGEIIYTDEKVKYFLLGDIVEAANMKNVTEERKNQLLAVKFDTLPLDLAVKAVRGNGKRTLVVFADPNCGYCKKLEKEMANVTDVTIYYFLYPILTPSSLEKSKAVWCSADRVKAFNDMMQRDVDPGTAKADCQAPIDPVLDLGRKLKVTGTPTIIFKDGSRIPGAFPVAQIEKRLDENK
ncbi:MAG TPA: DsbC family protein [Burkholderiales bacterium]|nr:DsbC family protein [Burkholderiales bacterium]